MIEVFQTYCGPAPGQADLWLRWNFDPFVLSGLLAALIGFSVGARHASARRTWCFRLALVGLFLAFVSPLCALTVALFSARVAHHVLLVAVVAPLLALALEPATRLRIPLSVAFLLHTAVFWVWHAPDAYAWALSSHLVYWLMQASLLGTAWLMWAGIFSPATGRGYTLATLLGTVLQMGMLGALLTFASSPLYVPHFNTTLAFGLDPLTDQQLAGILMWVPASLPYLAVAAAQCFAWLGTLSTASSSEAG